MDGVVAADDVDVADPADMGDGDGFDAWVSARVGALLRFAYLVTGSQEAAEESVQTALTKACEQWPRVSRMDDRDAYVRRMIINAHVSWWRKFRRREVPVALVRPTRGQGNPTRPDHAGGLSDAEAVWQLCATLPPNQRASVVLRFYEDLSYREIAAILQCPEATVRSHVHRALAAMRTTLEQEDNDD